MITHRADTVDPWSLREQRLHLDVLPRSESVFALSNGHIGRRGNLDEGEPHGLPGSCLNGVHELHPRPRRQAPAAGHPGTGATRSRPRAAPAPVSRPPPRARRPSQPQNVDSSVLFTVAYTGPLFDVLANAVTLRLPFFEVNAQV